MGVAIFFLMIALGFPISGKVTDKASDKAEVYSKALKIKDADMFNYAVSTRQGALITEGEFEAVDPVKFDEMTESFAYVTKTREDYVQKIRHIPEERDSKGNVTSPARTEIYWEWDVTGRNSLSSKKLSFFEKEYDTTKFSLIRSKSLYAEDFVKGASGRYLKTSSSTRYSYSGVPKAFSGSFVGVAGDDGLKSLDGKDKIILYSASIEDHIENASKGELRASMFFWLVWIMLTGGIIYAYVAMENNYLD